MTIILYNAFKRKSITHIKVCDFMKKCAVINDISGFGKCSLAVQIPILSSLGIEVHPAPTAVLSNQTAYGSYCSHDMSDFLEPCFEQWKNFPLVLTLCLRDILLPLGKSKQLCSILQIRMLCLLLTPLWVMTENCITA